MKTAATEQVFITQARAIREYSGFTQAQMARALTQMGCKIDTSAYARVERGQRGLGLGEAVAICEVLGVSILGMVDPSSSIYQNAMAFADALGAER